MNRIFFSFSLPLHYRDDLKSVLIPYGLVQDRIEALASRIFSDLHIHIPEQLSKKILFKKINKFIVFSLYVCTQRWLSILFGSCIENSK
jgi:hypothetical protein